MKRALLFVEKKNMDTVTKTMIQNKIIKWMKMNYFCGPAETLPMTQEEKNLFKKQDSGGETNYRSRKSSWE